MDTFVVSARGPFSLSASTGFLEGFTPAAFTGMAGQPLERAFPVEGTGQTARLPGPAASPGLPVRSPECFGSVAAAPLAGRGAAARLRPQPRDQALAQLKKLPGIGDFSPELVLLRGAAAPACIPRHEPRFARAV